MEQLTGILSGIGALSGVIGIPDDLPPANIISGVIKTPHYESATYIEILKVDIPYKGNGYPVALLVYLEGGVSALEDVSPTRSAMIGEFALVKANPLIPPTYDSDDVENQAAVMSVSKYSGEFYTYGIGVNGEEAFKVSYKQLSQSEQIDAPLNNIAFDSNTRLSMACVTKSTLRKGGLMPDSTYIYHIIYLEQ